MNGVIVKDDIIESGSNTNGSYTKYSNGTMICYKTVTQNNVSFSAWGSWYESAQIDLGSFPQSFKTGTVPIITAQSKNSGGAVANGGILNATASSCGYTRVYRPNDPGAIPITIDIIAIGEW